MTRRGWSIAARRLADLLCAALVLSPLPLQAAGVVTNISPGNRTATSMTVTPVGSGNRFDITTGTVKEATGFNHFFSLDVGALDTARLHVPSTATRLVNVVDAKMQVDGIVEGFRNGQLGGKLYFASPRGVVIGSGGVLRADAIVLSTPTSLEASGLLDEALSPSPGLARTDALTGGRLALSPDAPIDIKGRIEAPQGVRIYAGAAGITVTGDVLAGGFEQGAPSAPGLDPSIAINMGNLVDANVLIQADGGGTLKLGQNADIRTTKNITLVSQDIDVGVAEIRSENGAAQAGDVTLSALDTRSTQGFCTTCQSRATIKLNGAEIAGENVTLDAGANSNIQFDLADEEASIDALNATDPVFDQTQINNANNDALASIGTGLGSAAATVVNAIKDLGVGVNWEVNKANASVQVQGSRIRAAKKLTVKGAAETGATLTTLGSFVSVSVAATNADSRVEIFSSDLQAGDRVDIDSSATNSVSLSQSANSLLQFLDIGKVGVAVADVRTTAATLIGSNVNVVSSNGDVTVDTTATKSLSVSNSMAGNGKTVIGAVATVSSSRTEARTDIAGSLSASGTGAVAVHTTVDSRKTSGSSKVLLGDSASGILTQETKKLTGKIGAKAKPVTDKVKAAGTKVTDFFKKVFGKDGGGGGGGPGGLEKIEAFAQKFGASASVLVSVHENAATTEIGNGKVSAQDFSATAGVSDAGVKNTVSAEIYPATEVVKDANGDPVKNPDGSIKTKVVTRNNAVAAGVLVGEYTNRAQARVSGASRIAAERIEISARTRLPYELTKPLTDLADPSKGVLDKVSSVKNFVNADPGTGGMSGLVTNWTLAATEAQGFGLGASVSILDYENKASASIDDGVHVGRSIDVSGNVSGRAQQVRVDADVSAKTVNLAGVMRRLIDGLGSLADPNHPNFNPTAPKFNSPLQASGSDTAGIGGSVSLVSYDNAATARVGKVRLRSDDLLVDANVDLENVNIAASGGPAGKFGFNGSAGISLITSASRADLDAGIDLEAGRVHVDARDAVRNVTVGGGVTETAGGSGVGIGVGVSVLGRTTEAYIGNPSDQAPAGGSATRIVLDDQALADPNSRTERCASDESLCVSAASTGYSANLSIAGTHSKDAPPPQDSADTPSADPGDADDEVALGDTFVGKLLASDGADLPDPSGPQNSVSGGATDTQGGKAGLGISGTVAWNDVTDNTRALVNTDGIDIAFANPSSRDHRVAALDDTDAYSLSGAVTLSTTSSGEGSSGIAGAFAYNDIGGETLAALRGTAARNAFAGDLDVAARFDGDIYSATAGMAGSTKTDGLQLAGSVSINNITHRTRSEASGDLEARGRVRLEAHDSSGIYAVGGAVAFGGKAGVGAGLGINTIASQTTSTVSGMRATAGGGLRVEARNSSEIKALAAALAVSGKIAGGVAVALNTIGNTTRARAGVEDALAVRADTELLVGGDVEILADDSASIGALTIAGGVAFNPDAAASVGATFALNRISSQTRAEAHNLEQHDIAQGTTPDSAYGAANDLTVEASSDNAIQALTGGGAITANTSGFSGGAAVAVNHIGSGTEAVLSGPATDLHARSTRVAARSVNDIDNISIAVGVGGALGVAGSVSVNTISGDTTARIDQGARVYADDNISVIGDTLDDISSAAGAAAITAGTAGVGATVTVNLIESSNRAFVDGATLTARASGTEVLSVFSGDEARTVDLAGAFDANFTGTFADPRGLRQTRTASGLVVNASSLQHIVNIGVTAGGGSTAGVAGTGNGSVIKGQTSASVRNSQINEDAGSARANVDVNAGNQAYITGAVGTGAGGGTAGVGASADVNVVGRSTTAYIDDSDVLASGDLRVRARAIQSLASMVLAGAGGGTAGIGASASVDIASGATRAYLESATVEGRGDIEVSALSQSNYDVLGGAGGGGGVAGVAGAFNIAVADSTTEAEILGSTIDQDSADAGDEVRVTASHATRIDSHAVSGSGGGAAGVAALAVVNVITDRTDARVANSTIGSASARARALRVEAIGTTEYDSVAGALAGGGAAGVGAGASISVVKNGVVAEVVGSDVFVTGDASVRAESRNDLSTVLISGGGGGAAGVSANVAVTLLGGRLDPGAETTEEFDQGGNGTLSAANASATGSRTDRLGAGADPSILSSSERQSVDNASRTDVRSLFFNDDPNRGLETRASIDDSRVIATEVAVEASDASRVTVASGSLGIGGFAGVGAGVTVAEVNLNVTAETKGATAIEASGGVAVRARALDFDPASRLIENVAVAGGAGLVGIGASVAHSSARNRITAALAGQSVDASRVAVASEDRTDVSALGSGNALGAGAAGVSVGIARKDAVVRSLLGADLTTGNAVTLTAKQDGVLDAKAIGATGGALGAATSTTSSATATGSVSTSILDGVQLDVGSLDARAESSGRSRSQAVGVAVGPGVSIGASVALSEVGTSPGAYTVSATTGEDVRIKAAGDVSLTTTLGPGGAPISEALAAGGTGGLFAGAGHSADSRVNATTVSGLGKRNVLDIGGDLSIRSGSEVNARSDTDNVSVGGAVIGFALANTRITNRTEAFLDQGTSGRVGGVLRLDADAGERARTLSLAGSGGLVSGSGNGVGASIDSTTLAELRDNTRTTGLSAGALDVLADHNARFDTSVVNVGVGGLAIGGDTARHTSKARVTARVGDRYDIEVRDEQAALGSGEADLKIRASNRIDKAAAGVYKLDSTAAGVVAAGGSSTATTLDHQVRAELGDHSTLTVAEDADPANRRELIVEAINELDVEERGRFSSGAAVAAGGLDATIASAPGTRDTVVVAIGRDARLVNDDQDADIALGARTSAKLSAVAHAKLYGAVAGGGATSSVSYRNRNEVRLDTGAGLSALRDVTLQAGKDTRNLAGGYLLDSEAQVWNFSLTPFAAGKNASATLEQVNHIDIADRATVASGGDIRLDTANQDTDYLLLGIGSSFTKGPEVERAIADFSNNIFTGTNTVLQASAGTTTRNTTNSIRIDGELDSGRFAERGLTVGYARDGNGDVARNPISDPGNPASSGFNYGIDVQASEGLDEGDEYALAFAVPVADLLSARIQELRRLLAVFSGDSQVKLALENDIRILEDRLQLEQNKRVDQIRVRGVQARSGNILLFASEPEVTGSGVLKSPSRVRIEIDNLTHLDVAVEDLVIPQEAGGRVLLNDALVTAPALNGLTVHSAGLAGAPLPEISIRQRFDPLLDNLADPRDPSRQLAGGDILLDGELSNLRGDIRVDNRAGNIFSTASISAGTIDLVAPNGGFFQDFQPGFTHIGGDPSVQFALTQGQNEADLLAALAGSPTGAVARALLGGVPTLGGSFVFGQKVFISAERLNINGLIQSGIPDRALLLDASLDGRIATLAAQNPAATRLDIAPLLPPDPLGTRIGAVFDAATNTIELSPVAVGGGEIRLFGDILSTGGGRIRALDGFGTIAIDNRTTRKLRVNGLDTGGVEGRIRITDTARRDTAGNPLVTEYRRRNGTSIVASFFLGNESQATTTTGSAALSYQPRQGQVYHWVRAQDSATRTTDTFVKKTGTFFDLFEVDAFVADPGRQISTSTTTLSAKLLDEQAPYVAVEPGFVTDRVVSTGTQVPLTPGAVINGNTADQTSFTRTCTSFFIVCWEYTYTTTKVSYDGTRNLYNHAVRADQVVPIEFIGSESAGRIDIDSLTGVELNGRLRNAAGPVRIATTGGEGILAANGNARIAAESIVLSAANPAGSARIGGLAGIAGLAVQQSGSSAALSAEADANIELRGVLGSGIRFEQVRSARGDVTLRAEAGILGAAAGSLLKGRSVTLVSQFGAIGSAAQPVRVDTDPLESNLLAAGRLEADAEGLVHVAELSGDLNVGRIRSRGGDVKLTGPGALLDLNLEQVEDAKTVAELEALWADAGLTGAAAQASIDAEKARIKSRREADYAFYWRQRNLRLEGGVLVADPADPSFEFKLSAADRAGLSAAEIAALEAERTRAYRDTDALLGPGASFDPGYQYTLTAADAQTAQFGAVWTEAELKSAISDFITADKADTQTTIEQPNLVAAGDLVLDMGGEVGSQQGVIRVDRQLAPVAMSSQVRVALASAERDDIEVTSDFVRIEQKQDVDIEVLGGVDITAVGNAFIGSQDEDINVRSIRAGGDVRVKSGQGIRNVAPGANDTAIDGNGLILEAALASVGEPARPVVVDLEGTLSARAKHSVYVRAVSGDLDVDVVRAAEVISLRSDQGAIRDSLDDQVVNLISARTVTLDAAAGVGTAANALELRLAAAGTVSAAGGSGPVHLLAPDTPLSAGRITSAAGVRLASSSDRITVGTVQAGGDVSVAAGKGIDVDEIAADRRASAIELVAGDGSILQDGDAAIDVTGKSLRADATSSDPTVPVLIDLDTEIDAADLRTGSRGDVVIDEKDDLRVNALDIADGAVRIDNPGKLVLGSLGSGVGALRVRSLSLASAGELELLNLTVEDSLSVNAKGLRANIVHLGEVLKLDLRGPDGNSLADNIDVRVQSGGTVRLESFWARNGRLASNAGALLVLSGRVSGRGEFSSRDARVAVKSDSFTFESLDAQFHAADQRFVLALRGDVIRSDAALVQGNLAGYLILTPSFTSSLAGRLGEENASMARTSERRSSSGQALSPDPIAVISLDGLDLRGLSDLGIEVSDDIFLLRLGGTDTPPADSPAEGRF